MTRKQFKIIAAEVAAISDLTERKAMAERMAVMPTPKAVYKAIQTGKWTLEEFKEYLEWIRDDAKDAAKWNAEMDAYDRNHHDWSGHG